MERNAAAYLIGILNGKILAEESKEDNLITREQVMEFLITLPEQEPQVIIDTMIRKVVLFDDKIELHYNFCDKPEHDEPDGTSPEDRRVFPISFQSTLSSSVPPRKRHRISGAFFVAIIISHVREDTAERGRGRGRERFPPPKFSRRKRLVAFRMFTAKSV